MKLIVFLKLVFLLVNSGSNLHNKLEYHNKFNIATSIDIKKNSFNFIFNDSLRHLKVSNTKDGIKNGYWIAYYPNGNKKEEGHFSNNSKNGYWKTYYENGVKKEEGKYGNDKKNGYWFYYTQKATKIKEGHYNNNIPKMWWKFYTTNTLEKCLYQNDGKTRYCLIYKGAKLIKGRKYINDTFVNEWNSLSSFRNDNPNFSF